MNLGERLRQCRESRRLSRRELGEMSNVSESAIKQYEYNLRPNASADHLHKLAEALDVTVDYLLGRTDDPYGVIPISRTVQIVEPDGTVTTAEMPIFPRESRLHAPTVKEEELLKNFDLLNDTGQGKAVESVELLTKVPEYREKEETQKEQP